MILRKFSFALVAASLSFPLSVSAASTSDVAKVLKNSDCTNCDLSGMSAPRMTNLAGINLSGSNLSGVDFEQVRLFKANLSHTDLSGANLAGANLGYALMNGAKLCNTTMPDGQVIYSGC